jgi:hypothetical protein
MFQGLRNNNLFLEKLMSEFNAEITFAYKELELLAEGEMMLGAEKELKQELKRLWNLHRYQEKTIKNDKIAKFLENDSIKLALRETIKYGDFRVQQSE